LFDGRFRTSVAKGVDPVGTVLVRTGISADQLTAIGLVVAAGCAVAIGAGYLGLGLVLLIGSALPDLLDGAVAKAAGSASARGAFFDSVADRVSDTFVLGGIAWYLASHHGGHAALLPFAVLGASTLISYERAKAESLGFTARGGLMERAERIIALCVGVAFSVVLVPVLWIMLALTLATAVQRFAKVWRQAGRKPLAREGEEIHGGGRLSAAARWREWRAMAGPRAAERQASAGAAGRRPGPTLTWRRSATRNSGDTLPSRWRERQARRRAARGL
jgi:CDP-diacylglycerol--glycerol-3-phosphate 3-phosphatidyltransferase